MELEIGYGGDVCAEERDGETDEDATVDGEAAEDRIENADHIIDDVVEQAESGGGGGRMQEAAEPVPEIDDVEGWINDVLEEIDEEGFHVVEAADVVEYFAAVRSEQPQAWKRLHRAVRRHCKGAEDLPRVGDVDEWIAEVGSGVSSEKVQFEQGDTVEVSKALEARLVGADAFLVEDSDDLVFDQGRLYRYDAGRAIWEPIPDSRLSQIAQDMSGMAVQTNGEGPPRPLSVGKGFVSGAIDFVKDRHDAHAAREGERGFFDDAPRGVIFEDVFLRPDLDGGEVIEETPAREHRARHGFGFPFDPDASAPRFDQYLGEIFEGDDDSEEKQSLLVEFAGACLLGCAVAFQRALVLYDGTEGARGANGKSVFIKVLEHAFPAGAVSSIAPQDFGHRFKSAALAGRSLNVVTEMPEGDILAGDAFKGIITGDPITREFKHEDPFSFRPRAGHVFACNTFPAVQDTSGAFWRRLLVVPFNRRFTGDDAEEGLEERLVGEELEGIVAQFVEGGRRVLERGQYTVPASCERAHEQWKREANPVELFLIDETTNYDEGGLTCTADGGPWTQASELYEAYTAWCDFWGFGQASRTKFGRRVVEVLGADGKKRSDGSWYRVKLEPRRERAAGRDDSTFP